MPVNFQKNICLSNYTTIGLGGNAKYFAECESVDSIMEAIRFGRENNLKVQVMSGGSNIIFPDSGFEGLVIKVNIKGVKFEDSDEHTFITVNAGVNWDELVIQTIERGLSGLECLSGIPGSCGSAPVQNLGAYGQEVKNTIISLKAIDRHTLEMKNFTNAECLFGYRQSRFKSEDQDKFIICEVTIRLSKSEPVIRYPELQKFIENYLEYSSSKNLRENLMAIRNAVITLRKKKSMVIDKDDPNTRSCGSFFMNPLLTKEQFIKIQSLHEDMPYFTEGNLFKIPAAWLIEKSGFHRGFRSGGAGISDNHSLAIINLGGSTNDVITLAKKIERQVHKKFQIVLIKEPVIVN